MLSDGLALRRAVWSLDVAHDGADEAITFRVPPPASTKSGNTKKASTAAPARKERIVQRTTLRASSPALAREGTGAAGPDRVASAV
jgi:hypothetical protein